MDTSILQTLIWHTAWIVFFSCHITCDIYHFAIFYFFFSIWVYTKHYPFVYYSARTPDTIHRKPLRHNSSLGHSDNSPPHQTSESIMENASSTSSNTLSLGHKNNLCASGFSHKSGIVEFIGCIWQQYRKIKSSEASCKFHLSGVVQFSLSSWLRMIISEHVSIFCVVSSPSTPPRDLRQT